MSNTKRAADVEAGSRKRSLALSSIGTKSEFIKHFPDFKISSFFWNRPKTVNDIDGSSIINFLGERLILTYNVVETTNEYCLNPLVFDILCPLVYICNKNCFISVESGIMINTDDINTDDAEEEEEEEEEADAIKGTESNESTSSVGPGVFAPNADRNPHDQTQRDLVFELELYLGEQKVKGFIQYVIMERRNDSKATRAVVQVKRNILCPSNVENEPGFWQVCAEMAVSAENNLDHSNLVYGILSDGYSWVFLMLQNHKIQHSRACSVLDKADPIRCTFGVFDALGYLLHIVGWDGKKNLNDCLLTSKNQLSVNVNTFMEVFRRAQESYDIGKKEGRLEGKEERQRDYARLVILGFINIGKSLQETKVLLKSSTPDAIIEAIWNEETSKKEANEGG